MGSMKRGMFVDPGLGGTGWALFEWDTKSKKPTPPIGTGVIRGPRGERWDNKVWSICRSFAGTVSAVHPVEVAFEMPEIWSGSAKSHASSTHKANKGEPSDLHKLIFLIGGLAEVAREKTNKIPILITVEDWKGQLPKKIVLKRLKSAFGVDYKDHEGDAVGMGLSAQGGL